MLLDKLNEGFICFILYNDNKGSSFSWPFKLHSNDPTIELEDCVLNKIVRLDSLNIMGFTIQRSDAVSCNQESERIIINYQKL